MVIKRGLDNNKKIITTYALCSCWSANKRCHCRHSSHQGRYCVAVRNVYHSELWSTTWTLKQALFLIQLLIMSLNMKLKGLSRPKQWQSSSASLTAVKVGHYTACHIRKLPKHIRNHSPILLAMHGNWRCLILKDMWSRKSWSPACQRAKGVCWCQRCVSPTSLQGRKVL